jgi:hypothetical protein
MSSAASARAPRRAVVRTGLAVSAVALAGALGAAGSAASTEAVATTGDVAVVQAVPDEQVSVTVDGRPLRKTAKGGTVIGPVSLSAGSHEVAFTTAGETVTSTVDVQPGTTNDLVLHRPAAVGGTPVVSTYPAPLDALGPGKARVLLAHTATTAPADVRVDGETVFTNIANGEYAQADVAAGTHEVALYPSGVSAEPILGPITVDLGAGTLTSVYAVGNPAAGSMDVVVRTSGAKTDSTAAPRRIETGSAGLVGRFSVRPFGSR